MSETIYRFYYDGTAMSLNTKSPKNVFEAFDSLIPKLREEYKTDAEAVRAMLSQLETLAVRYYEISDKSKGTVNPKDMRKAWGKNWMNHEMIWCCNVYCISKLCPSYVNNKFGVMSITGDLKALFGKDYKEYIVARCASCNVIDVKHKKCGRCEAVHYCSPECQKAHWKTHKLTCVPLNK